MSICWRHKVTRKNIFEILKHKYNVPTEMNKIISLFNSPLFYSYGMYNRGQTTAESVFDKEILKTWKQRGSFLSCEEIKKTLGLKDAFHSSSSIDDILKALEYYQNIAYFLKQKLNYLQNYCNYTVTEYWDILIENMQILLNHLNYEFKVIPKEEKLILIPKNPAATSVAEISDEETAMAILMYNHHTLKGDIEAKRELLNSIARTYEPLLKNPIEGYNDFFKKTNQLLNNLHIRHNNFEEENNKNLVIDIDDRTLEHWYDELYQLLLFCVLIDNNLKRKKEAELFLKELKQGA